MSGSKSKLQACLSDVHLIGGTIKFGHPKGGVVTLGHEVAGFVDIVGPEVSEWQHGQRVLLKSGERGGCCHGRPHTDILTRGVDFDGGWAEFALATATTLVAIPDDLPFEQAAIIPDAVETPWSAITVTGDVCPAQAVGVWGVGGLGAIQLLRLVSAVPIITVDPLPAARARALEFGEDVALDPANPELRKRVLEETGGTGINAAFDFAGAAPVREQAIS
jgi:threonine dehydrogenase-like Zn-dependent dehydrogenase